jgi:hypothetical protein
MIIKVPQGPIRPIIEAQWEMELFVGFARSLEDSARHQREQLETKGGDAIEIDGYYAYEVYHGIDGSAWSLETVFTDWFPAMQRSAAFMVVWGWLERQMNEFCIEVQRAGGYQIAVTDLTGEGLTRMRTYLLKVANLSGDWSEKCWQELPHLQRIRNLFAHAEGRLTPKHEMQRSYAEASPHIKVENDAIYLKDSFMPYVFDRLNEFLASLYGATVARFGPDV